MNKIAIEIKNLNKKYDEVSAVKDLNFKINKGSIIGLLGPNGCGKTTTIGMILGLIKPTFGNVFINEKNIGNENNRTNISSPRYVSAGWHKVAAAGHSVAAIKSYEEGVGGTLWAWGANQAGELANNEGEPAPRSTPCQIPGTNWTSIQGTYRGFVAGKQDGTMWVWGTNGQGELGLNDRTDRSSPTQVPGSWAAGSGSSKLARVYRRKL